MQSYHRRTDYTFEEKTAIVEYIVNKQGYNGLRGNAFWQEMEAKKILHRTWQSMKEHFRKKIVDIIHIFNISDEEKRLIKEGWETSRVVKHDSKSSKIKRRRPNPITNVFSDEEEAKSTNEKSRKDRDDENYVISDGSDSSTIYQNINTGRKIIRKRRNKTNDKRRRSPSEFNVFSDEDDNTVHGRNVADDDSPDLLNMEKMSASCSKSNVIEKLQKPTSSKDVEEPSSSGLNNSFTAGSDSGGETIVNSDILRKHKNFTNINNSSQSNDEKASSRDMEEFSMEEDISLLDFMRSDKLYLQKRNQLDIYKYFHLINQNTKSPKLLKDRFLDHIFPNVCEYSTLTDDEMKNFYKDAGVKFPDNLKRKLQKLNKTNVPSLNKNIIDNVIQISPVNIVQKNFEMNVCEHELSRNAINSIYCQMMLNGKPHIFVADINSSSNKKNIAEILSKKIGFDRENIHYINFESYFLLEQINKFRSSICKQYENIIVQSLQNDNCANVNVQDVIDSLEICFKVLSSEDEDSSSESTDLSNHEEEKSVSDPGIINSEQNINTQQFCPNEISTPHRRNSEIVNEENMSLCQEIKEENLSSDELPCANVSKVSNEQVSVIGDRLQMKYEPRFDSNNSTDFTQSIEISDEEENQENFQLCLNIKDDVNSSDNSSHYLESVPTQESTEITNAVTRMVQDNMNVNNSAEVLTSTETFHTATEFS